MNVPSVISNIAQNLIDCAFELSRPATPTLEVSHLAKLIAHRGGHDLTTLENTMQAFRNAESWGADGIEFDIRWTKDHVPIVHHDAHTWRIFQKPYVLSELNFSELRAKVPQVPSLEEVLLEFGNKLQLHIEIKEESFTRLEEKKATLKQLLSPFQAGKDFVFLSLKASNFEAFSNFDPSTYILVSELNASVLAKKVLEKQWGGLTGHYVMLNRELEKKLKGEGKKVGTGFAATRKVLWREWNRNLDWVYTNHCHKCAMWKQELRDKSQKQASIS